ncbi:MAG: PH domain-containing protein [Jatrophihabitantaceae bacterium]
MNQQAGMVQARPVKAGRIAIVVAVLVAAAFLVCAIVLPHTTDGVNFTAADQFGIAGTGLLVAIGIGSITRPRLRASADGVDTRPFFGSYRHVSWDLVNSVEFPPKARFARLVLPGDELIVLYAVQRGDAERSVQVMRQLRELHAASR